MCWCDLGIDKTAIEELQVLSHTLSGHEIQNNCFIYGESISNQKIEAWWSILFVNQHEIILRNRSELQYNM